MRVYVFQFNWRSMIFDMFLLLLSSLLLLLTLPGKDVELTESTPNVNGTTTAPPTQPESNDSTTATNRTTTAPPGKFIK